MEYKLVLSDLDATLLTDDKRLLPATTETLSGLVKSGVKFAIASARRKSFIDEFYPELSRLCCAHACTNGTYVETADGDILVDNPIGKKVALYLAEQCESIKASFIAVFKKEAVVKIYHPYCESAFKHHHGDFSKEPDIKFDRGATDFRPYLMTVVSEDLQPLVDITGRELPEIEISPVLRMKEAGLEVMFLQNKGSNKKSALLNIANYYSIELSATLAIGDDLMNDQPMLEAAGYGVAVKNAHREVKEKADCVTERNNNENGVGKFIGKLFNL